MAGMENSNLNRVAERLRMEINEKRPPQNDVTLTKNIPRYWISFYKAIVIEITR